MLLKHQYPTRSSTSSLSPEAHVAGLTLTLIAEQFMLAQLERRAAS
jgi:hypothetical protein